MSEPVFVTARTPLLLDDVRALTGARFVVEPEPGIAIRALAPLDRAGPGDVSFIDATRYVAQLRETRATACFVPERLAGEVPKQTVALVVPKPHQSFVTIARSIYADLLRPTSVFGHQGIAAGAFVHPQARIEADVTVDPGAVVGPGAEVGAGSLISANAVVGPGVRIGRNCHVGVGVSLTHALLGDRVIIHPGARIGQDGFGYVGGHAGHVKIPQIGRVIIQDDVEIGANTSIDRGGLRDTVIGEGTKIDNLVQIAHNVVIGRHCIIVSQTGIAGSATLGDFVMLGGQVGVIGHVHIGHGAQIAATSNVKDDVPPGVQWGGSPAKPMRDWFREVMAVQRLGRAEASATRKTENGTS